jgi:outer membrane receptor protein involved in Fe transport
MTWQAWRSVGRGQKPREMPLLAVGKTSRCSGPARRQSARGFAVRFLICAAFISLFRAPELAAQQLTPADLGGLPIEQLLDVPLVVSVASKRPQRTEETPAVVFVVTADQIRRHGYRTLADVLRSVPDFYVTCDRNYSYVGVRGFGRPGDYNTRILLLIDGVRMNDNIYDGAYVGQESPIDLDVVERIEISRGPGAAIYGDSAFFAVVSIVTKRAVQQEKGELRLGPSSYGGYEAHASFGHGAEGAGLRLAGSLASSDGQTLFFPEFSSSNGGIVRGGDAERAGKLFAVFSKNGFSLEFLRSSRTKHIPTASYETVFGDTRAQTRDAWTAASLSYERPLGHRIAWTSHVSSAAYDYDGTYPTAVASGQILLDQDSARGRWWAVDSTGVAQLGRQVVTIGGEFTHNWRQDQAEGYAGIPSSFANIPDHGVRFGAFAQGDLALGKHIHLSLGGRYDHHEDFGGAFNPRLALIAMPEGPTTLKVLYGSAYRAPNEYEQNYYAAQRLQTPLEPETIRTIELELTHHFSRRLTLETSAFSDEIHQLITLESASAGELVFRNAGRVTSKGGQALLSGRLASGAAASLAYSFQRTRNSSGEALSNSPAHMVKASLELPIDHQAAWASVDARYMSSRITLAGASLHGSVLVDATVLARGRRRHWEVGFSLYNAFDVRYSDPASEEHRQDSLVQDGRSFVLTAGWRF